MARIYDYFVYVDIYIAHFLETQEVLKSAWCLESVNLITS